jgi:D-alanine--poly(phosphoribitol) ligase subunit 1
MSYIYNLGLKFKQIAKEYGDKTAIKFCDGTEISFAELESLSNRIANWLLEKGISKNQVVAIQNNKTAAGYAIMLACLKIGAIYTNFDSSNPKERLDKIFETAKPALIISDTEINPQEVENQKETLSEEILAGVTGENSAYIMFTSGSTGIPKGVLIKQESLLNFIDWGRTTYNITSKDVLTNVNPIYFDNSVFDFYCSIFNGASLGAFPKNIVEQPKKMLELIDKMGCTFWFSVPSFLIYLMNIKLLNKETFKTIRAFSFGGEGYPKDLLKKLYELYSDRAKFFNVYGPTEGTCICSAYKIQDSDFADMHGLVTLGHIAPNFDYLILDKNNNPSKLGELCLIGAQLAVGYYNDKERTAKSFVNNPTNFCFEQKMYKTGDLVEEKEDGMLYFVGRADNQIKHMGYRIELEEIEANLIKLPCINQCAVVHGKTEKGFSKLIAYIATDKTPEQKELRERLREFLPDYMIPNIFEFVEELPKNHNGKVDRVALKKQANLL